MFDDIEIESKDIVYITIKIGDYIEADCLIFNFLLLHKALHKLGINFQISIYKLEQRIIHVKCINRNTIVWKVSDNEMATLLHCFSNGFADLSECEKDSSIKYIAKVIENILDKR